MKNLLLILIALFFGTSKLYSQIEVKQITYKGNNHFITTTIGYPLAGIFLYDEKTEPIIQLNSDGTGIYQDEDLTKKNIIWGVECSEKGVPIFKEGFNSASYSLWYKPNDEENWITVQLSIHYNKKKMFIMGERIKSYEDYNDLQKPKLN